MLFSNVNGVGLDDKRYWPLYEKANELGAVLFIHPIHPLGVEAMTEFWLMPLVGFLMDTTLAAGKLVFSGVVRRFPRIVWVLAHLGGAIPYLAERLDRGYRCLRRMPRQHRSPAQRVSEDVLLRHGELRSGSDHAGHPFRRSRAYRRRQRLPAPDRQLEGDEGSHRRATYPRVREGKDSQR